MPDFSFRGGEPFPYIPGKSGTGDLGTFQGGEPFRAILPAQVTSSTRTVTANAALLSALSRTATASAALQATGTRSATATGALRSTVVRGAPVSAALLSTVVRTVSGNAALYATGTRTVGASVALYQTNSRTVGATAALRTLHEQTVPTTASLLSVSSFSRTVEASAALWTQNTRTVTATASAFANETHTVACSAALFCTWTRALGAGSALLSTTERMVAATAALQRTTATNVGAVAALLATGTREVAGSVALRGVCERTVLANSALATTQLRTVTAAGALLDAPIRALGASAALSYRACRTVPATAALYATGARTSAATATLVAVMVRGAVATTSLIYRTVRATPVTVSLSGGSSPRTIVRHVFDERTGNPIAGVRVVLERVSTGDKREAVTDATGGATFAGCHGTDPYRTYVYSDPVRVYDERDGASPHNHDERYLAKDEVGAGSGLDADLLDGHQASEFATAGDYVQKSGDTVTGSVVLDDESTTVTRLELGNAGAVDTPTVVFHSTGSTTHYDSRIVCSGGSATADGQGTLNLQAKVVQINGREIVPPQATTIFLRQTADYSIGTGAWQAIPFDVNVYEYNDYTDSMWADGGSWVHAPITGLYQLFAQVTFAGSACTANTRRGVGLRILDVSGGMAYAGQQTVYVPANCTQPIDLNVASTMRIEAGRYVELCAFQDTGADLAAKGGSTTITNGSYRTCLSMTLLTPLP